MLFSSVLDTVLDRTIVAGYSRVGHHLRRTWWAAGVPPGALDGHAVAITGANSGLGKATALGAARLGASVRMLCRDVSRGEAARADVIRACPGAEVSVDQCDVSSFGSVRGAASRLRDELAAPRAIATAWAYTRLT